LLREGCLLRTVLSIDPSVPRFENSETSKRRAAQWRDSAKPFYNLGRMIYSLDGLTRGGIAMLTRIFEKKTLSRKAAGDSALEQET
jgi:hypothetical protein